VRHELLVSAADQVVRRLRPARLPSGAALADGPLAQAVCSVDARIWGLRKTRLDLRVLATDATGRVVFDSGQPSASARTTRAGATCG
jgi:two-component system sensor histidine kinase CreC